MGAMLRAGASTAVLVAVYYVLTLLVFVAAAACALVLTRHLRPLAGWASFPAAGFGYLLGRRAAQDE